MLLFFASKSLEIGCVKFAFCLFKYFPFGGLQRDFLRIARACIARGHSVEVYTMRWEGEKDPNIPVHLISVKGWQNHTRAQHFIDQISPKLGQYDMVLGFNKMPGLHAYYAADTCFQAKAREKHGWWYRLTARYRHWVAYEKAVFTSQSHVLLISEAEKAKFMQFYGTKESQFHWLPPGIARDRIAPENATLIRRDLRKEFKIKENDFLMLLVGSGFKTKGLDRILHGIAALPKEIQDRTSLFVIGKDHSALFQRLADQLKIGDRVNFLGGRDDVPRFLLAADALLHPAYNENTGTVLLEALASGLPVLTTDNCGYATYVQKANAGIVLSSPFKQQDFNQALQEIVLSEKVPQWKLNAIQFAKEADIYSLPERAAEVLEKIARTA